MFEISNVVLINKCDTLKVFDDFSVERVKERILKLNPRVEIFPLSAKTGEGFNSWISWLKKEIKN